MRIDSLKTAARSVLQAVVIPSLPAQAGAARNFSRNFWRATANATRVRA
jgi:hypothetical protein